MQGLGRLGCRVYFTVGGISFRRPVRFPAVGRRLGFHGSGGRGFRVWGFGLNQTPARFAGRNCETSSIPLVRQKEPCINLCKPPPAPSASSMQSQGSAPQFEPRIRGKILFVAPDTLKTPKVLGFRGQGLGTKGGGGHRGFRASTVLRSRCRVGFGF